MRRTCLVLVWLASLAGPALVAAQNHPELRWQVLETPHFRILYHQGLEGAAGRAASIAEAAYEPVTALYSYHPQGRVRITLRDTDDYGNGAAFYYEDAIEIWATALEHDFELRGTSDWLQNVITHEFTHVISLGAARKMPQRVPAAYLQYFGYQREKNRPDILTGYPDVIASYPVMMTVVPMWFAEGVAQYMAPGAQHDRWDSHRDMILRVGLEQGTALSFDEMGVFDKCGFGNEYVYDHGYGLVLYIAGTYGAEKLAALARAAATWRRVSFDAAVRNVLGISVDQLYSDWVASLRQAHAAQLARLGPLVEGDLVAEHGFSNLRPALSPDGTQLAYLSTRDQEYGPHALVLRDLATGKERVLTTGVTSTLSWAPDGRSLFFVRIDRGDAYGSRQADLYQFDLTRDEPGIGRALAWAVPSAVSGYAPPDPRETRLSRGLRALYPACSPDGRWLAFVRNQGTNNNLGLLRLADRQVFWLTRYSDGTQLYTPQWSPDGQALVLSVTRGGQRDIALLEVRLPAAGASSAPVAPDSLALLVATPATDRDPTWTRDGRQVVFASDVDSVLNLYSIDVTDLRVRRLSRMGGGALAPAVAADGRVYFVAFGRTGYQIRCLGGSQGASDITARGGPSTLAAGTGPAAGALAGAAAAPTGVERDAVHSDGVGRPAAAPATAVGGAAPTTPTTGLGAPGTEPAVPLPLAAVFPPAQGRLPAAVAWAPMPGLSPPQPYGIDFLRTSILPRLTVDEGRFKGGAYVASSDVLGRQSVFAGAAVAPTNRDRDLFAMYEYRGARPTLFLEAYQQQRHAARHDSTEARDGLVTGLTYNLYRMALGGRGRLGRHGQLELTAAYDRYDASVDWYAYVSDPGSSIGQSQQHMKPYGYTYLHGFDLGALWRVEQLARRRDRDISPRGRQLEVRYDRFLNYFVKGFNTHASFIDEQYLRLAYGQLSMDWREHVALPGASALSLRAWGGWIDSDRVDAEEVGDFFDFHVGGIQFLRGYTYYSLEGRKAAMGSATLRVPLVTDWGARLMQLYLDRAYGAVYAEAGKAWDRRWDDPDPRYRRRGPVRDVGGQVRLDMISYYSVPTRVEADLAYGVDELPDRSPWKFYLTVLFGYL